MAILGLQKMLLILGSKAAVEFRDRVLESFNRVLAGDRTLIREAGQARGDAQRARYASELVHRGRPRAAGGGRAAHHDRRRQALDGVLCTPQLR